MSEGMPTDSAIGTTENNGLESMPTADNVPTEVTAAGDAENAPKGQLEAEAEVFSRDYVEKLRKENAGYRLRANEAEKQLHHERVKATGLLADPADLPYDEAHMANDQAITDAINVLLATKPHLRARKVTGDVGQGRRDAGSGEVDLAAFLRSKV